MPELRPLTTLRTALRGVVPATYPALLGKLVFDASAEIPVARQPGLCVVHVRVMRSSMTGLLVFGYRLEVRGADWDVPVVLSVVFEDHSAQLTFADFRVDSPGVAPPNTVEVAANGDFAFCFDYGLCEGRGGRECFVATNAREFRERGGRLTILAGGKGSVLNVPAPIGLPLRPVTVRAEEQEEAPPDAVGER